MTEKKEKEIKVPESFLDVMKSYSEAFGIFTMNANTMKYLRFEAQRNIFGLSVAKIAEIEGMKRTTLTTQMSELKFKIVKYKNDDKIDDEYIKMMQRRAVGELFADSGLLDNVSVYDLTDINKKNNPAWNLSKE